LAVLLISTGLGRREREKEREREREREREILANTVRSHLTFHGIQAISVKGKIMEESY
jgi:hypothetical protein